MKHFQRKIAEKIKITVTLKRWPSAFKKIEQQSGLEKGALFTHFTSQGVSHGLLKSKPKPFCCGCGIFSKNTVTAPLYLLKRFNELRKKWIQEMRQPVYLMGEIVLYESTKASLDQQKAHAMKSAV